MTAETVESEARNSLGQLSRDVNITMHRISCTIPAFILSIAISLCSYNVVSIAREEAVTYEPAEDVALDLDSRDDENEESGDENLDLYNDDDVDELQSLLEQNPNDKLDIDDSFLEEEFIEQYDLGEEENQPYYPMGLQTSWSRGKKSSCVSV